MSLKPGIGNAEYLKKRVPRNAKYQHIKTKLDTGCSLSKYMEKVEEMSRNYRYRSDEIFKRLKVTTFAQLVLQVASVSKLNSSLSECDLRTEEGPEGPEGAEDALSVTSEELEALTVRSNGSETGDVHTARSTLLRVISGMGELTVDVPPDPGPDSGLDSDRMDQPYPDCPYLLLDVRDREQYDSCHIISAHSFPAVLLSRAMNPYTREVLAYKNASGKIIIVYDEDERIASAAATVMCQRGFENLFMLSGGLKVLSQKFPGSLVSGPLPPLCVSDSARGRRTAPPSGQTQAKRTAPPSGHTRAERTAPLSGHIRAERTAPPSGYTQAERTAPPSGHTQAEQRWRFTAEELTRLSNQLDEALVPINSSSRTSSRISSVSSQSSGSRHSSASSSSRPWK